MTEKSEGGVPPVPDSTKEQEVFEGQGVDRTQTALNTCLKLIELVRDMPDSDKNKLKIIDSIIAVLESEARYLRSSI